MGVDPAWGKPLGVAVLEGRRLKQHFLGEIEDVHKFLSRHRVDRVVIEDQYLNRNFSSAKKLSWACGQVMGVCRILQIPYSLMNVAHWKSVMACKKGMHVERATEVFGVELEDDVASASLIALTYLTEYPNL